MGKKQEMPVPYGVTRRDLLKGLAAGATGITLAGMMGGCSSQEQKLGDTGSAQGAMEAPSYEVYSCDLLILGGGYAAKNAARAGYEKGLNVIMVDKGPFGFSGGAGMNWSAYIQEFTGEDPVETVRNEIIEQGGVIDQGLAYEIHKLRAEQGAIARSVNMGTSIERFPDGTVLMFPGDADGINNVSKGIFMRHEADYVKSKGVAIYDRTMITNFIVQDGICTGAMGIHVPTGTMRVFRAQAVICTSGQNAQMFGWDTVAAKSNDSIDNTADFDAIALRHGCRIQFADQVSCDMLMSYPSGVAYSYNGTVGCDPLYKDIVADGEGNYWMKGRDLTRAQIMVEVVQKIAEGNVGPNGGVIMDLRDVDGEESPIMADLNYYYKRNIEPLKEKFGIDLHNEVAEVGLDLGHVFAHPVTDSSSQTEIPGLFHVEGTCYNFMTNAHYFASQYVVSQAAQYIADIDLSELEEQPWDQINAEYDRLHGLLGREVEGSLRPHVIRHNIQKTMWENLTLLRTAEGINKTIDELTRIRDEEMPVMAPQCKTLAFNTEWKEAIENYNLLDMSFAIAHTALAREESRGFHVRLDFPEMDNENFLCKLVVNYNDGNMTVEKLDFDTSLFSLDEVKQMLA